MRTPCSPHIAATHRRRDSKIYELTESKLGPYKISRIEGEHEFLKLCNINVKSFAKFSGRTVALFYKNRRQLRSKTRANLS